MRKKIHTVLIGMLLIMTSVFLIEAKTELSKENLMTSYELINPVLQISNTDITVSQAQDVLTNLSNGIQIPIDVRSDSEWTTAHIETPYPENAQHWPNLQNGERLTEFMDIYQGKEIILYCAAGSRSTIAANLLVEHNFNGVIYNMLGGISAWIGAGYPTTKSDYSNITVDRAWYLLTEAVYGIQIPIDVRTNSEWAIAHIDTPSPENPRHWPYLQDGENLTQFMNLYQGKDIILYCKAGSRSMAAANLLVSHNFTGDICMMLGGIDGWTHAGYPTKANSFPNTPVISGENNGKVGEEYQYALLTTDIDEDNVYYYVNWSDNTTNQLVGPYPSGEAVILDHVWSIKGTYTVKVKARDIYGAESEYAILEIKMPKAGTTVFQQTLLKILEKIHFFFFSFFNIDSYKT